MDDALYSRKNFPEWGNDDSGSANNDGLHISNTPLNYEGNSYKRMKVDDENSFE
jgi:hypothetical protein